MGATEQTGPGFRRGVLQFRPGILDEESAKSGPSSLGGSEGCSACFIRQNSTAEPLFSCATAPKAGGFVCKQRRAFWRAGGGAARMCSGAFCPGAVRAVGRAVWPRAPARCTRIFARPAADMAHTAPARHQMCARGKKKAGKSQKAHTPPGVSCAIFGFIFLVFPLTARFFRLIMLIMYHHGLVCPCAKKMPKIFVHFDDFCPGRRAALRGVTKKRNMLKK